MVEQGFDIAALILKKLREEATPEESRELVQWLNADPDNRRIYEQLMDENYLDKEYRDYKTVDLEEAKQKFWAMIDAGKSGTT